MTPTAHVGAAWARLEGLSPYEARAVEEAVRAPSAPGRPPASLYHKDRIPARLLGEVQDALLDRGLPRLAVAADTPAVSPTRSWPDLHRAVVAGWGLRGDYQLRAVRDLLQHRGGILAAAAGSGKTVIAARVVEILLREAARLHKPQSVLWIAQTVEQVDQAKAALALIPQDIRAWAHGRIAVRCWQGIDARPFGHVMHQGERIPLAEIDILVGDECHASADAYYAIARECTRAFWRIGMSATPTRADGAEILMRAAWGRVRGQVSQSAVIDQGYLVPATIEWRQFGEDGDLEALVDEEARDEMAEFKRKNFERLPIKVLEERLRGIRARHARQVVVTRNREHHDFAAAIAREQLAAGHQVLVLVHEREQGRDIVSRIPGAALAVSGMTKVDGGGRTRAEVMDAARAGEIRCLVATSLADQGLDIPSLSCVVMAQGGTGGKNGYLAEQRAARAQRAQAGKTSSLIIDIFHAGDSSTARQSWMRHRAYQALGHKHAPLPEGMRKGSKQNEGTAA